LIGCGFIGSHIVKELAATSRSPVVLTRSYPEPVGELIAPSDLHLGEADDPEALSRALEGVDRVVFSAGGLLPTASEENPELDESLTLDPLRAVLEALRAHPGVTFTYLSSGGTVYGNPTRLPAHEDDPAVPISSYGKLHLLCEQEIERHRAEHGLRSCILRCSTVYGEYQEPDRGQGVIVTWLHRIRHGETIQLRGGGTARDYIYAGDVARAVAGLLEVEDLPPVVNVGSGESTSLIEILHLAEQQVGRTAAVKTEEELGYEVHRIYLDTSRLHGAVELEMTALPEGVAHTYRWLRDWEAE